MKLLNGWIVPFTPEELEALAAYDAAVDDENDWDPREVAEARAQDRNILDSRADPKKLRKRMGDRAYYKANKDRIDARNRAYAEAHAEEIKAYRKQYHQEHAEDILERRKAYAAANWEAIAEYQQKYHLDHKEEHNAYSRQYRLEHLAEVKAKGKQWRENHKEHLKAYRAANRERDNAKARERYAKKKAARAAAALEAT